MSSYFNVDWFEFDYVYMLPFLLGFWRKGKIHKDDIEMGNVEEEELEIEIEIEEVEVEVNPEDIVKIDIEDN
jgi:hypothetical protein